MRRIRGLKPPLLRLKQGANATVSKACPQTWSRRQSKSTTRRARVTLPASVAARGGRAFTPCRVSRAAAVPGARTCAALRCAGMSPAPPQAHTFPHPHLSGSCMRVKAHELMCTGQACTKSSLRNYPPRAATVPAAPTTGRKLLAAGANVTVPQGTYPLTMPSFLQHLLVVSCSPLAPTPRPK